MSDSNYSVGNSGARIEIKPHPSHTPLFSHSFFNSVVQATNTQPKLKKASKFGLRKPQLALLSLAAVLLIIGSYIGIVGWHTNSSIKAQAVGLTKIANELDNSSAAIGSVKPPALSTTPISASTLASYTVAPNLPRYLLIPELKVNARVLSVGVTSTGAIGTPDNINDTAWYNESAEPGQPGATVIDGHISSWTAHGVFYSLNKLAVGDGIEVERGDGQILNYKVVKTVIYPASQVNMSTVLSPVESGQSGLNLISCTGDVIPGTSNFSERIVVFATQS